MGLGFTDRELYATNVGSMDDRIFLSKWKPIMKDGEYHWPPDTPICDDMWAPNVLDLKPEEGPVKVKIVPSNTETGLWYVCYDADFIGEKHLYNYKPRLKRVKCGNDRERFEFDEHYSLEATNHSDDFFGLHVWTDNIRMESGDGPIPVTLQRLTTPLEHTLED